MNTLSDDIKAVYFKFLAASFGSTLISSIYGIVDMAMVGQYHGPDGSAALAVFAPIWNIIYSLGLLAGIGGSVLYGNARGGSPEDTQSYNGYFTAAMICGALMSAASWLLIALFNKPMLIFFGAEEKLLALSQSYLKPITYTIPSFIFSQLLASFLRNDGDPGLATASVLAGGVVNMFGDWFFVFFLDMGIYGAGLATSIGSLISTGLMLTHFLSRKNTLQIVWPRELLRKLKGILISGFPTCITDFSMGIMTILFNRQIMKYLGTNALAVYAIIINISTFVQCCAYSVGQAAQPIFSINYGAHRFEQIRQCLKYALATCAGFGIFWTTLSMAVPNLYVRIFMTPSAEVLKIAPAIIRTYSLSFLVLPLNVFSTYYFQAMMKPGISFLISLSRGIVVSGALILLLPVIFGANAVWFAMLGAEAVVAVYVMLQIRKCDRQLLV